MKSMFFFLIWGLATVANAEEIKAEVSNNQEITEQQPALEVIATEPYTWEDTSQGWKYRYKFSMPDSASFPQRTPVVVALDKKLRGNWEISRVVGFEDEACQKELNLTKNDATTSGVWKGDWLDLQSHPYFIEVCIHKINPVELERFHEIEEHMLADVNEQRVRHGLRPLFPDLKLFKTARRHCSWMTNNNSMTHGSYPVGENIAMGQSNPTHVITTWMNSPGHRANILNPNWRCVGLSAFQRPNGAIFWCQQFTQ